MSYLSTFNISIHNANKEECEEIFKQIEKLTGHDLEDMCDNSAAIYAAKWNNREQDLKALSKKQPNVVIEVIAEGEDPDDKSVARFQNGFMEQKVAQMTYPPFKQILLEEETSNEAKYNRFKSALDAWHDAQEGFIKQDIIDALKKAENKEIDLTETQFGQQPYFFISQERNLYCKKTRLDKNNILEVVAGEDEETSDGGYVLGWDDIAQDTIILHDFVAAIYKNEN